MTNIAIVGCGVIGLTTALAIQKKIPSAHVKIFSKEFTPNTTSDIAAGLWEPYLLGDTPPEKIYEWSKRTYEYVKNLWKEGKAQEAGVILQPVTYLTDSPNFTIPNWLDIVLGYRQFSPREIDNFERRFNQKLTGGLHFISFTWEGGIFLSYLQQQFLVNGGEIFQKEIQDLAELSSYDVVVNCTGIDARKLTDDLKVYPIRGQIIRAKAPWLGHIFLVDTKHTCYVIPNTHSVVLGGTKQPVYKFEVDPQDTEDILRKCKLVQPSLHSAEILGHKVGLRPARDKVRLETEIKKINVGKNIQAKEVKIVHNYGHGGAGVTLAVGCADEASDLVREVLRDELRHKL